MALFGLFKRPNQPADKGPRRNRNSYYVASVAVIVWAFVAQSLLLHKQTEIQDRVKEVVKDGTESISWPVIQQRYNAIPVAERSAEGIERHYTYMEDGFSKYETTSDSGELAEVLDVVAKAAQPRAAPGGTPSQGPWSAFYGTCRLYQAYLLYDTALDRAIRCAEDAAAHGVANARAYLEALRFFKSFLAKK